MQINNKVVWSTPANKDQAIEAAMTLRDLIPDSTIMVNTHTSNITLRIPNVLLNGNSGAVIGNLFKLINQIEPKSISEYDGDHIIFSEVTYDDSDENQYTNFPSESNNNTEINRINSLLGLSGKSHEESVVYLMDRYEIEDPKFFYSYKPLFYIELDEIECNAIDKLTLLELFINIRTSLPNDFDDYTIGEFKDYFSSLHIIHSDESLIEWYITTHDSLSGFDFDALARSTDHTRTELLNMLFQDKIIETIDDNRLFRPQNQIPIRYGTDPNEWDVCYVISDR